MGNVVIKTFHFVSAIPWNQNGDFFSGQQLDDHDHGHDKNKDKKGNNNDKDNNNKDKNCMDHQEDAVYIIVCCFCYFCYYSHISEA